MKAIEYFNAYHERLMDSRLPLNVVSDTARDLALTFLEEAKQLSEVRHAKTNSGFVAIVKELNKKWNVLSSMFKTKYGVSPLIDDGFMALIKDLTPGLEAAIADVDACMIFRKEIGGRLKITRKGIVYDG